MRLYVARHAECAKNLIGIPGGAGSALTPQGLAQAQLLAEHAATMEGRPSRIVACPPIQARQTAQIVADRLGLPVLVREELRSINLGVLTGVPIVEARCLHPVSSTSMDLWRSGKIELCDVKIEGMEDPVQFFRRGLSYILDCFKNDETEIIFATTSIMILFDNMHRMNGPARGEGYRVIEYQNTEMLDLNFSPRQKEWIHLQARKYNV